MMRKLFLERRRKGSAGFSLIEMLVAVTLFIVVMMVATTSLLSIVAADRKAQSLKSVMNNLNFALENMARNLRVGSSYHCGSAGDPSLPKDCANNYEDYIAFVSSKGLLTVYRLNPDTGSSIQKSDDGGVNFLDITAPEIKIDRLHFYVSGAQTANDHKQPEVLISVGGFITQAANIGSRFDIETLVSQRLIDQ